MCLLSVCTVVAWKINFQSQNGQQPHANIFARIVSVQLRLSNLLSEWSRLFSALSFNKVFILPKSKHFFFLFKMDSISSFCPHPQHRSASVDPHSSPVACYLAVNSIKQEESRETGGKRAPTWGQNAVWTQVDKLQYCQFFRFLLVRFSVHAKADKVHCNSKWPVWKSQCWMSFKNKWEVPTGSYLKAFVYDEIKHVWCGNKCTALQRQSNHTAKSEIIQESFRRASHVTCGIRRRRESKRCGRKGMNVDLLGESADTKSENIFRVTARELKEAR